MKKGNLVSLIRTAVLMSGLALLPTATLADDHKQIPRVAFPEKQEADLSALKWRFIGPMIGNRGSDVIGHPMDRNLFFHAGKWPLENYRRW